MLKDKSLLDAGWARRLCSGSLLQFVTREDFYCNDIPSLGFVGQKEYMVQNDSCAGSPFIMFLPFICLALPDDSPFWTAQKNEGIWEKLGNNSHKVVLENPGLVLVNHGKTGTSMEYSYRSQNPRDLRGDDVNFYLIGKAVENDSEKNRSYTTSQSMLYNGVRKDVLYRQAIMRKPPNNGVDYKYEIDFKDIDGKRTC